jgi:hypothetical protein
MKQAALSTFRAYWNAAIVCELTAADARGCRSGFVDAESVTEENGAAGRRLGRASARRAPVDSKEMFH